MTIDERIERLVERHEALAQSVELLLATATKDGENIRQLARSIRALGILAEDHEDRLNELEGGKTT